jgi:chemotaxis protein methyltransferase CheR
VSPPPHLLVADPAYLRLKERLIASTGLAYYADKDRDLAERVAQRLARLGLPDCAAYLASLEDEARGQGELDALIEDLTIGETFFFRHRELFDALRDVVLPDLIARNQAARQLRVWSAGCSVGTEPYSVSILLKRDLAARVAGWDVTILGTDINRDFLARAHAAAFESWALRNTPEEVKHACFTRHGSSWCLKPEYRAGVSFQYHNLVTHPFPSLLNNLFAFDLILCRNVTIYFSLDIVRRLVGHFHECLVDGGWLLVGHAEPNLELFRAFRTVHAPGAVLYQKSREQGTAPAWPSEPRAPAPPLAWVPPSLPDLIAAPAPPAPPPAARPLRAELNTVRALADRGEWERAEALCRELLARDKLNPLVHFYHGLVLEQAGRHAEAEDALRRVIYLDRGFVLGHYYLGLLLQKQDQMPRAARSFKNVLQLLGRADDARAFADGDGITAGELRRLTQMHLEVLEGA